MEVFLRLTAFRIPLCAHIWSAPVPPDGDRSYISDTVMRARLTNLLMAPYDVAPSRAVL